MAKIYGVTVGTSISPQSAIEKTIQAQQIAKNTEDISKLSEDIKNMVYGYTKDVNEAYKENEEFDFTASTSTSLDVTGQDIFNVGDKMIITFDGVKYVSVGEYFKYGLAEMIHFGNRYVNFGTSSVEDTGEPFCFYKIVSNPNTVVFKVQDAKVHTVSISKVVGTEAVKIPSEFLDTDEIDTKISQLSEEIANGGKGLTKAQINALDGMFKVCAYTEDVSTEYEAFKNAFGIGGTEEPDTPVEPDVPEATLTSISATYSGGDVTVGTSLDSLTGITVTATYSDGTSKTVSGYILSGTIAEGSNTITVSYCGKTTTFTVIGVAESGGETWEEPFVLSYATSTTPTSSNGYIPSPTSNTGYANACSTNEVEHFGGVLYCDMGTNSFTYDVAIILEDTSGTRYGTRTTLASNANITSTNQFVEDLIAQEDTAFVSNRKDTGYSFRVVIPNGYKVACLFFRNMSDKVNIIAQNGITFTLKGE